MATKSQTRTAKEKAQAVAAVQDELNGPDRAKLLIRGTSWKRADDIMIRVVDTNIASVFHESWGTTPYYVEYANGGVHIVVPTSKVTTVWKPEP